MSAKKKKKVEKDVALDLGRAQSVAESDQNFNPCVSVRFRQLELAVHIVLDLTIRSTETNKFLVNDIEKTFLSRNFLKKCYEFHRIFFISRKLILRKISPLT